MLDHLGGLRTELDRFYGRVGPLDAPVPSCPNWRVRDLVHHVGTVHRTFRRVAGEGWMQRPPPPQLDDRPDAGDDRIVDWGREQGALLVAALAALDPAAPRWNFSNGPQVGAFIPRRMHHETTIHRWDLEAAYGPPGPIDAATARDGVVEYLEVFVPRTGIWSGRTATVHVAIDGDATLELALLTGQRPFLRHVPTERADATLAGPPAPLLLALWDRTPLTDRCRSGDRSVIAELREFAYT